MFFFLQDVFTMLSGKTNGRDKRFLWQGTTSANVEDEDEVSFLSPKSQPPMILFTVQYIFQFDLYATFFFA